MKVWMGLNFGLQRIKACISPTWSSNSVSVFDSLGFRRFISEPGENCPSADEGITKYNWFSVQSIDALLHKGLLTAVWYL